MTKMERQMGKLNMYRVYGHTEDGNIFDEYCEASTAQFAVDRVREWIQSGGQSCFVEEVAKVVKGWK